MLLTRLSLCLALLLGLSQQVLALETIARAALVLDQTSGTVLLAKNENMPIPPASMSKLMTVNMLFEALQDGRVTLDTLFTVSAKASKKGGSRMFLREGEQVSVENLIKGIVVQSGNDACIVVAENLAGSEEDFARIMTLRAAKLGMTNSNFTNATGWPDPKHRMSAADLVLLAERLMTQFPEYYGYFQIKSFTWAGITQANRNPLLGVVNGADGLKTGHTIQAGYGLVASAKQDGRRVILMITGLESLADRRSEGERLLNWAFRQFSQETLIEAQKKIADAPVWMGQQDSVPLLVNEDVSALVPYATKDEITMSVTYNTPLNAPVLKGTEVGTLNVDIPGLPQKSYSVFTGADVANAGLFKRLKSAAQVVYNNIAAPSVP